ncbi:MAG: hypothetical protein JKY65_27890 [Planctomycetes bacterium]|nr:hypothetical protein [Planctomycetota bacterium]
MGRRHGDNLQLDKRRGYYYWRKTHPQTGRRIIRNTLQTRRDLARRVAARFDDELREEIAGVKRLDHLKLELKPLAEEWLREEDDRLEPKTSSQKRRDLMRALEALKLRRVADLMDLASLNRLLFRLRSSGAKGSEHFRRCYQAPLKGFSRWLAGNHRYLANDPLANWEPLKRLRGEQPERRRRAYMPDRLSRSFMALDYYDQVNKRRAPSRPVFVALLVTAPRLGAFLSRGVEHLLPTEDRIDYGEGCRNKRRGRGALDASTLEDLLRYVGGRTSGPLFLGPRGGEYSKERLLDTWREALSLAVVDSLWPRDAPPDLHVADLVARALRTGRIAVHGGGNPSRLRPETISRRAELKSQVRALADRMRGDWESEMRGCDRYRAPDLHAFRATHRTWAAAVNVPPTCIDKQLGHARTGDGRSLEIHRVLAGSSVGSRFYTDLNSELFDASKSAEAVRQILDQNEDQVLIAGGTPLAATTRSHRSLA